MAQTRETQVRRATSAHAGVDARAVDAFVAGTLDADGEAALAAEVADLVFAHRGLPNATVGALSHLERHLGGGAELLEWLSAFDGKPRTVAGIAVTGDLLDRLSGDHATIEAVDGVRSQDGAGDALAGHLVASGDSTAFGSLSYRIETIAGRGELAEARRLSLAVLDLLGRVARQQPSEMLARETECMTWARGLLA